MAPPLRTVLLVDDEPDIRLVARMSLELAGGLTVLEAGSGEEALALAGRSAPDLILLDVMMPGLDGPDTLAALRERSTGRPVPVVFMTARVQPAEVAEYRALGACGVVGKPFDPMALAGQLVEIWNGLFPASAVGRPWKGDDLTDLLADATASFVATLPGVAEELEVAAVAGNAQVVRAISHRLRGTAGTFTLMGISAAAGEVEDALKAGRPLLALAAELGRLDALLRAPR